MIYSIIFSSCKFYVSLIFLTFLFISCNKKKEDNNSDLRIGQHIQKLEPYLTNNLYTLSLDTMDKIIEVNPDIESTILIDSLMIADLSDIELDKNFIYLADEKNHHIISYDIEKNKISTIGQEGRGPGDLNKPTEIRINSKNIFVYETGNARIQIFNKNFEPISEIAFRILFSGGITSFDVNENSLFAPFSLLSGGENVIQVYEFADDEPFNRVFGFMPKLTMINVKEENLGVNLTKIRADLKKELLYISYHGLPYIFIFDNDLKHIKTLKLTGDYVEDFYKKRPDKLNSQSFSGRNVVRSFIKSFDINDKKLYVIIKGDLFLIDLESNQVLGKYRFNVGDEFYFGNLLRVDNSTLYLIDDSFNNRVLKVNLTRSGYLSDNAEFILY